MSDQLTQPRGFAGLGELSNMEGLDLTTVSTDYPVLATNNYPFKITKAIVDLTKDKSGELLVLDLVLEAPAVDTHGKPVAPGYKLTHRIGLTPKEKRTVDMIMRDVATLLDAVYGESGRKAIDLGTFDMANLVNQVVTVRTRIEPEQAGYPEKTGVARFVKKENDPAPLPA